MVVEEVELEDDHDKPRLGSTSEDSLDNVVVVSNGNHEDEKLGVEKQDASKEDSVVDGDGNLSDEGLGDITSEASNSPQPPSLLNSSNLKNGSTSTTNDNNTTSGQNGDSQNNVKSKDNANLNVSSPCDERVPSRIPLLTDRAKTKV